MNELSRKFFIFVSIIVGVLVIMTSLTLILTSTITLSTTKPTLTKQENAQQVTIPVPHAPVTGSASYGYVTITILSRCAFDLLTGWSFFSLCADPDDKDIDSVLNNTDFRYVLRWNTTRMEWDIFSPRATENSFDNFSVNESYFTLLYANKVLSVGGDENDDMNITMITGWDAPSWPYVFEVNVTKYLNESQHRYMLKWNKTAQEFLIYSPRAASNPFTKIYKAEGQMMYAYINHTLVYNKTYLQS